MLTRRLNAVPGVVLVAIAAALLAMAERLLIEQGAITIPPVWKEPEATVAPMSRTS